MTTRSSIQRTTIPRCFLAALLTFSFLPLSASAIICQMTFGNRTPRAIAAHFKDTFGTMNPIIGMIHLAGADNADVVSRALEELQIFSDQGVHAAIIENYHGSILQMLMVLRAAQNKFPKVVLGINVLPNEYRAAFPLARKYGAKFIQLDFVSGRYQGIKDGPEISMDYGNYWDFRKEYREILVLGGVHPKYYKPVKGSDLAADLSVANWAADAVVVTGSGTGKATPLEKIQKFRNILGPTFPLVIGAGVTAENARQQLFYGNGAIIGSYFKNGETFLPVVPERVAEMKAIFDQIEADQAKK